MAASGITANAVSAAPQISVVVGQPQETPQVVVQPTASARPPQQEVTDRVTLQSKLLEQLKVEEQQKLEQQQHDEERKQRTAQEQPHEKPVRRANGILFSYNFRGDLRIRFMDSVNNLVYQTPPLYFTRLADILMRPETSIDTEA